MPIRPHRVLVCLALLSVQAQAGDWPAFRGPLGNGVSDEKQAPTNWGPEENVKWKTALPGPGNGSPIVSNGRVFLAGANEGGSERSLLCFDRETGDRLWERIVTFESDEKTHKTNPYCGSTPVSDGSRVVVWHGSAGLYCYDLEGQELWSRQLGEVGHMWGYGSSPVLYNDAIILNFGPGVETFMTSISLDDGSIRWKTDEPGGANDGSERMVGSWSTPVIAHFDGADQIICSMPTRVVAYEPNAGDVLWTCDGLSSPRGDLAYSSISVAGNLVVAMGGYKGPALAVRLGGSGDVTESRRLWHIEKKQPQRIGSGVVVGEHLFIANAGPDTAQCIELETGEVIWSERLGANAWGSVVKAGNKLYVTTQDGNTTVFRPNSKEFESVAVNSLEEPSNSTPAISDGEIFLRTEAALYCIAD